MITSSEITVRAPFLICLHEECSMDQPLPCACAMAMVRECDRRDLEVLGMLRVGGTVRVDNGEPIAVDYSPLNDAE